MRSLWLFLFLVTLGWPAGSPGAPTPTAVDRGRLSLARDAHDSGRCGEALRYLEEIPRGSAVAGDAAWLRAECLYDLGQYAAASRALEGVGADPEERADFLLDVYWAWAWEATAREDYAAAAGVCRRGLAALPGELSLGALEGATAFRAALARMVAAGRDRGSLASGEEVAMVPLGRRPEGSGWVRAYPWDLGTPWVPRVTLGDWMPSLAARLDRTARALWLRFPAGSLARELPRAAAGAGLRVHPAEGGVGLRRGQEVVPVTYREWEFRAAAEGLGGSGAALAAVSEAHLDLEEAEAFWSWVELHRGDLVVSREGGALAVRDPRTGRSARLDPRAWSRDGRSWGGDQPELWAELRRELRQPSRPFRCFCGRDLRLREALVAEADRGAVFERGGGYAVILTAQCPWHQQTVGRDLLAQWGVTEAAAWARARADGAAVPWELWFQRGEVGGVRYLVLEGEGASGLARYPALLLGAVEAADGAGARNSAVRVFSPSSSFLVVTPAGAPERVGEAAATQAVLGASRRGRRSLDRLDYRATVELPATRVGQFRLTAAD